MHFVRFDIGLSHHAILPSFLSDHFLFTQLPDNLPSNSRFQNGDINFDKDVYKRQQLGCHICQLEGDALLGRDGLAELDALLGIAQRVLKRDVYKRQARTLRR